MKMKYLIAISVMILGLASCKSKESQENTDVITEKYAPLFKQFQEVNDSIKQVNACDSVSAMQDPDASSKVSANAGNNDIHWWKLIKTVCTTAFSKENMDVYKKFKPEGGSINYSKVNRALTDSIVHLYSDALKNIGFNDGSKEVDNLTQRYFGIIGDSGELTEDEKSFLASSLLTAKALYTGFSNNEEDGK